LKQAEAAQRLRVTDRQVRRLLLALENYSPEQMERFKAVAPVHTIQPPYDLIEREIEGDVLPYAVGRGITNLTYAALWRGLLSAAMGLDRQFAIGDMRKNTDPKFQPPHFTEYLNATSKLDAFAREDFGKRVIHLAVGWLLDQTRRWYRAVGGTPPGSA